MVYAYLCIDSMYIQQQQIIVKEYSMEGQIQNMEAVIEKDDSLKERVQFVEVNFNNINHQETVIQYNQQQVALSFPLSMQEQVEKKLGESVDGQLQKMAQQNRRLVQLLQEKDKKLAQKDRKIQQLSHIEGKQSERISKLMKDLQKVSILLQKLLKKELTRYEMKDYHSPPPKQDYHKLDLSKIINEDNHSNNNQHNVSYDQMDRSSITQNYVRGNSRKDLSMSYYSYSNYTPEVGPKILKSPASKYSGRSKQFSNEDDYLKQYRKQKLIKCKNVDDILINQKKT